MFTNYSCKYHEILGYDHDMYVMKYVGMLRIYISQVSMRSAENRYIYKVTIHRCAESKHFCMFLQISTYVDVLIEVDVKIFHV